MNMIMKRVVEEVLNLHFDERAAFSHKLDTNGVFEKGLRGVEWVHCSIVLVSPCFRENVVVTSKIGSFLCSLDN